MEGLLLNNKLITFDNNRFDNKEGRKERKRKGKMFIQIKNI